MMQQGSRALAFGALLSTILVLSGCAAGAPAVLAPETPVAIVAQAPDVQVPAPEPALVSEQADVPGESAAVRDEAPAALAENVAPVSANQPTPPQTATSSTAAFAQDVPLSSEPPPDEGSADQPPPAEPAADTPVESDALTTDTAAAAPAPGSAARPAPPPDPGTGLSEIIEGGTNGRLEVALTFDAGADTGYGAQILDLLRDEGIHATFGMTGVYAQANPDLVRRMAAEGHQLMNHSWDHSSLTGANTGLPPLTPEQVAQQLWNTENVVSEVTGGYQMLPYFRPPYGDYDATSLGYLYNNGYYLSIWWTCDSHGWAAWGAQEIIDYCTTNLAEDEILLLHVGAAAVGDFEALPGLIQFFRDNGYAFVTVEEMLQP